MRLSKISIIGIIALLLFSQSAIAQSWPNPGHPASQVGGGTFNASYGNFLFPSGVNVTADSTTFHVDATGDKVGIGTASPSNKLHVAGNATISNDLALSGGIPTLNGFEIPLSVGNGTALFGGFFNATSFGVYSTLSSNTPNTQVAAIHAGIPNGYVISQMTANRTTHQWVGLYAKNTYSGTTVEAFLANRTMAVYGNTNGLAGAYAGYFYGDVSITNGSNNANLCLNGDCKSSWPSFGSMSSFNIAGDSGSDSVSDGQTATIKGGTDGIDTQESGRSVTLNLDWSEVDSDAIAEAKIDFDTACTGDNKLLTSGNDLTCSGETDPYIDTVTNAYVCYGNSGSHVECNDAGFYWDSGNNRLGVGGTPDVDLQVVKDGGNFRLSNTAKTQSTTFIGSYGWLTIKPTLATYGLILYENDSANALYFNQVDGVGYISSDGSISMQPSSGSVGIGTASPAAKLHVQAGSIIGNATGAGVFVSGSGVYGTSSTYGVYGQVSDATGNNYGVYGATGGGATANYGLYGSAADATTNYGVYGSGTTYGVYGYRDASNYGYLGSASYGVSGYGSNFGVYGYSTGSNNGGVYGSNGDVNGALATSPFLNVDAGVFGNATGTAGTYNYGVLGFASSDSYNIGVVGTLDQTTKAIGISAGVFGGYNASVFGYMGSQTYGVYGEAQRENYGIYGYNSNTSSGLAIVSSGSMEIRTGGLCVDSSASTYCGASTNMTAEDGDVIVADGALCVNANGGQECPDATTTGNIYYDGATAVFDLAEGFPTEYQLDNGDIVVVSGNATLGLTDKKYDSRVVGVVSTTPNIVFNYVGGEIGTYSSMGGSGETIIVGESSAPITLAGRVPVKVTDENGPIRLGDLITTSSRKGYGMRWSTLDPDEAGDFDDLKGIIKANEARRHAIIGKALEPLDSGEGKIIVIISLQ